MASSAAWLRSVLAVMAVWVTMGLLAPAACQTAACQCGDRLFPNETLIAGESRTSLNGLYLFIMQADCNLVLYHKNLGATWASQTYMPVDMGKVCFFTMQADGNAVIYRGAVRADLIVFQTNTGKTGARNHISVQDDGNVIMYDNQGRSVWSTNTAGT